MGVSRRVSGIVAIAAMALGCSDQSADPDRLSKAEVDLAVVSNQLDDAHSRIDSLETTVSALRANVVDLLASEKRASLAYLSPGDSGFSAVRTPLGVVLFRIHDVQPFASGSRVTLRVANLTGIAFTDMKMRVTYASTDAPSSPDSSAPLSKDHEILGVIPHGVWQFHTITLDGIAPEKLATLDISDVTPQTVYLRDASR